MNYIRLLLVLFIGCSSLQAMNPRAAEAVTDAEQSTVQSDKCAICLTDLDEVDPKDICTTLCDHRFCRACLDEWSKTSDTCPVCRDDLCSGAWVVVEIRIPKKVKVVLDRLGIITQSARRVAGKVIINFGAPTALAALVVYCYMNTPNTAMPTDEPAC